MDLVVECGIEWLVVQCECFWEVLFVDECECVVCEGCVLYVEFGDLVVMSWLECELWVGSMQQIGSCVGWNGVMCSQGCGDVGVCVL